MNVNLLRALIIVAVAAASESGFAQSCSGGAEGGMDATGCACNTPGPAVAGSEQPSPATKPAGDSARAADAQRSTGVATGGVTREHRTRASTGGPGTVRTAQR